MNFYQQIKSTLLKIVQTTQRLLASSYEYLSELQSSFINEILGMRYIKIVNSIQIQMSNTMLLCNKHLFDAYQLLQKGQLAKSINQYQLALRNTYNTNLKSNIKCTISILQYHLNKQNNDQMLQCVISSQNQQPCNLITLRAIINCILIDILQGRSQRGSQYFDTVLLILQQETSLYQRKNLLEYISYLLFRVRAFEEIPQFIENMDLNGLKLQEIFSISLMAFNSQICKQQSQQRVQRLCYEQYMKHRRYDLAIFCLRSLIKFTKNNLPNKEFYQKQLAKLIMLGYFNDNIDFQNYQSYEVMQAIIDKFIKYKEKIIDQINKMEMKNVLSDKSIARKIEQTDKQIILQWKYTIILMMKQVRKNKQIDGESKDKIKDILNQVKKEENILVIRSMAKNNYFAKYHQKVHLILQALGNQLQFINIALKQSFQAFKSNQEPHLKIQEVVRKDLSSQKSRLSLKSQKNRSAASKTKPKEKDKQFVDKQNNPPLGISIVSVTSSKFSTTTGRRKIFQQSRAVYQTKKLQKMVKMCENGGFLNKRNYNSQGGQYRFVKITNSFIKWGKDPQKIQTNYQIYPLKDVKSIVYGRISPNLNQNCNKMLGFSKCFSLLLQKRTLDFYCKNYQELQEWVCGISAILKRQQVKVVGYTPGKLRWKKMFAILKENFIEPLKTSEKEKYYYQKAYSLILFKNNGYKLNKSSSGSK